MKLGDYIDVISGYALKSSSFNSQGMGMPVVRIRDIIKGATETYSTEKVDSKYLVEKNDILVGMDGNFHIRKWQSDVSILNQRVCKVVSKDENILSTDFLFYLLPKELKIIEDNTPFVTVKHLSVKKIQNIDFDLPDLRTQQQIVAVLDKAQSLIRKREQSIQLLDELLKAIFLDRFGDPVLNEKGWETKLLKNVTTKIGSGSTPRGGKGAYFKEGISLIRSLNVHDNFFKTKDLAFIDEQQANKLKNVIVESGDVLFNITGASVCRSTIVPDAILPARVNQHVAILRTRKKVLNPTFLLHALISDNSKLDLLRVGQRGGATREAITKDQLENHLVIVPEIKLQLEFEKRVKKIERIKAINTSYTIQSKGLFQSLLQDAFAGKIKFKEDLPLEVIMEQYQLGDTNRQEKDRNQELIQLLANSKEKLAAFKTRLEKQEFENIDEYEKYKAILFEVLNAPKSKLEQVYDRVTKKVVLS